MHWQELKRIQKQIDLDLDKIKDLYQKESSSPILAALMFELIFLPKMVQQAERKDIKIKLQIKRTKLNQFSCLDNLKDTTIKTVSLMQIFKEYLKVSLLDLMELELNNLQNYLLPEESFNRITLDLNNSLELLLVSSKALLKD